MKQHNTNINTPFYFPKTDQPAPQILFVQHFNLLCDGRMPAWQKTINELVNDALVVADLGSGTGILSMVAAQKAKKVYSVEIDPHLAEYSRAVIARNGLSDKIQVINEDATKVRLPEKADVIICEMLDTGLIKEQQVQVMNYALDNLAKHEPVIIPSRINTSLILAHTDYDFLGFTLPLPYFETGEVRKTVEYYSQPVLYHSLNLSQKNKTEVNVNLNVQTTRKGIVNSIKMITVTDFCNGERCGPSHWFNPPLVLPVEPFEIKRKDVINVRVAYQLGGGLKTLDYKVGRP